MEKETLIQTLRNKVGENDFDTLSQRTLNSIIDPLVPMFADDTKVTDETWVLPVNMLKSYIGQYRHDLADGLKNGKTAWESEQAAERQRLIDEAVEDAKKQWLRDNQNSDPAPQPDPQPQLPSADEITKQVIASLTGADGVLGKMSTTMQTFMEDYNRRQREQVENGIREALRAYLVDELNADRDAVVNLAIQETKIPEKADIESLKADVKSRYETRYKEFYGDMGTGGMNGAFGGGKDSEDDFNEFIAERKKAVEDAKKGAEALGRMLM